MAAAANVQHQLRADLQAAGQAQFPGQIIKIAAVLRFSGKLPDDLEDKQESLIDDTLAVLSLHLQSRHLNPAHFQYEIHLYTLRQSLNRDMQGECHKEQSSVNDVQGQGLFTLSLSTHRLAFADAMSRFRAFNFFSLLKFSGSKRSRTPCLVDPQSRRTLTPKWGSLGESRFRPSFHILLRGAGAVFLPLATYSKTMHVVD